MGDDRDESDSGDSDEDWVSWFCCLAGEEVNRYVESTTEREWQFPYSTA
jgi:hypothetical protein